jgi:hypothetical protein
MEVCCDYALRFDTGGNKVCFNPLILYRIGFGKSSLLGLHEGLP